MIGLPVSDQVLTGFLLVYCRVQMCLFAMPGLGDRLLTVRVRVLLAVALTPLLAVPNPAEIATVWTLALLALAEAVTGLVLGLIVRLAAFALDIAATTIATTASLSQIMGVTNDAAPHPIGNLMHLAGLALLMALGFPVLVSDLLGQSFAVRPVGGFPDISTLMPEAVRIVRDSFVLAMVLSAPFILGGILFQLLSGVVSKVMPSLPIVFMGAPLAIIMALVALAILMPAILNIWAESVMDLSRFGLP